MKKIISLILLFIISLFLFTGCGNKIDETTFTSDEGIWYVKGDPTNNDYDRYYKFVIKKYHDTEKLYAYLVDSSEKDKNNLYFDGSDSFGYLNKKKDNEFILQDESGDLYTFNKEDCNNDLLLGTYINKNSYDNLSKTIKFERVKDNKIINKINKVIKEEEEKHKKN